MKVLIAFERSGVVREAFRAAGHDAISCDLEPTEQPGPHLQGDVHHLPLCGFDLIIAHPPCTALAVSGNRTYANSYKRMQAIVRTVQLWERLIDACPRVAMENPVGVLSSAWSKPAQYIQPWQFGHGETKKTGLWLYNLPLLEPTDIVDGREQRVWKMGPSAERSALRGKTYQGIADAMAAQWG